jgi:TrmH RNA methyltransferase
MRNKLVNELAVCGLHAVEALGEVHPERINRLFLREDRMHAFGQTCKNLAERKRPYKICADEELERICKTSHHQGVVAMMEEPLVAAASFDDIDQWAAEGRIGLVLHNIGNDHNLGAMVRSAAFFGAYYVIICGEDAVPDAGAAEPDPEQSTPGLEGAGLLTTAAYRVAEGGMEYVTILHARKTAVFLKSLSKKVLTIGTERRSRQRLRDLPYIAREWKPGERFRLSNPGLLADFDDVSGYGNSSGSGNPSRPGRGKTPIAIVMGNEETGLPPEVKEQCSCLLRIPGSGVIDSLNVSQAAAIFLEEAHGLAG